MGNKEELYHEIKDRDYHFSAAFQTEKTGPEFCTMRFVSGIQQKV